MISRALVALIALAIAMLGAARAGAEPVEPQNTWTFTFTPYGWVTWLHGDQTVRGRTVEVEVDPIQLIEHLESVPFMGYAEARKGPLARPPVDPDLRVERLFAPQ